MRISVITFAACLSACSLVLPASDHQGGVIDAGERDFGVVDAAHDANDARDADVDAGECQSNVQCDPSGLIACIGGECRWCAESREVATGTPADTHPRTPLHTLIVPPDGESPAGLVLSYGTPHTASFDTVYIVRQALDATTIDTSGDALLTVGDLLPADMQASAGRFFGFAMVNTPGGPPQDVSWTSFNSRPSGFTYARFFGHGNFLAYEPHTVTSYDEPLSAINLPEPAIVESDAGLIYVARTKANFVSTAASLRSRTSTANLNEFSGSTVPLGDQPMSASGAFVAFGANASLDVLLWNPNRDVAPSTITAPGRSTRPVLAGGEGGVYYLAYGVDTTLEVQRATCADPASTATCHFSHFTTIATGGAIVDAPAMRLLSGRVVIAMREASSENDRVTLRVLRTTGDAYSFTLNSTNGADYAVVDEQLASAFVHDDVDLAVADIPTLGPQIVVTFLRGEPAPATTPRLLGIARFPACQP